MAVEYVILVGVDTSTNYPSTTLGDQVNTLLGKGWRLNGSPFHTVQDGKYALAQCMTKGDYEPAWKERNDDRDSRLEQIEKDRR